MSLLGKALRLSPADWLLLGQAWWLLAAADLAVRTISYARLEAALFGPRQAPCGPRNLAAGELARLVRLVDIARRHHPANTSCLRRALVLRFLLLRQGVIVDMRIGVRRTATGISAHAWLEDAGQPIAEPAAPTDLYTVLSHPGPPPSRAQPT